jgi:hypothetical protein
MKRLSSNRVSSSLNSNRVSNRLSANRVSNRLSNILNRLGSTLMKMKHQLGHSQKLLLINKGQGCR